MNEMEEFYSATKHIKHVNNLVTTTTSALTIYEYSVFPPDNPVFVLDGILIF